MQSLDLNRTLNCLFSRCGIFGLCSSVFLSRRRYLDIESLIQTKRMNKISNIKNQNGVFQHLPCQRASSLKYISIFFSFATCNFSNFQSIIFNHIKIKSIYSFSQSVYLFVGTYVHYIGEERSDYKQRRQGSKQETNFFFFFFFNPFSHSFCLPKKSS